MGEVNWQMPAELRQIGVEGVTRGTLAECVDAYRALPEADRAGAMILSDELVPLAEDRPAAKSVEADDLAWLADQRPG